MKQGTETMTGGRGGWGGSDRKNGKSMGRPGWEGKNRRGGEGGQRHTNLALTKRSVRNRLGANRIQGPKPSRMHTQSQ